MLRRVTTSDNDWYNEWQQMITSGTTNDNEWQRVIQQVTTSDTTSDNEWQRVVLQMKTNENEWEQVKESDFGFRMKQNMQCATTIYSEM